MADSKISALTSLASGHATGDLLPIVDVSDTTQAASGTTKQTTLANLLANLPGPTNAVGISYTGQSLTGSNASTLLNLATTWNTSGTPTALKLNVTDTASNASSLFLDLQASSVSKFSVSKSGVTTFGGAGTSWILSGQDATGYFTIGRPGNLDVGLNWNAQLVLASTHELAWSSVGNALQTTDTGLKRHAAGVVRVTNGSSGIRGLLGGGAAVASATALPVPTGRVFHVTGTTTVTSITSTNHQSGTIITMIFDASLTFTHGNNIVLAGAANFSATANDTLTMVYDGTNWYEVCRSVN